MKKKTDDEVLFANLLKAKRAEIRLRHSMAADREIFATIPTLEADFWRAVQLGVVKEFVAGEVTLPELEGDDEV